MALGDTYEGAGRYARGVLTLIGGLLLLPVGLLVVGALDVPSILIVLVVLAAIALVVVGARELIQQRSPAGRPLSADELRDFTE